MWRDLTEGALGALVIVDTRRLDDCYPAVDYFEKVGLPFVVAVNLFDGRLTTTSSTCVGRWPSPKTPRSSPSMHATRGRCVTRSSRCYGRLCCISRRRPRPSPRHD